MERLKQGTKLTDFVAMNGSLRGCPQRGGFGQMRKLVDRGRIKGPCGRPQASTLLFHYVLRTLSIGINCKHFYVPSKQRYHPQKIYRMNTVDQHIKSEKDVLYIMMNSHVFIIAVIIIVIIIYLYACTWPWKERITKLDDGTAKWVPDPVIPL